MGTSRVAPSPTTCRTVTWKVEDQTGSTEGLTDELANFQLAPIAAGADRLGDGSQGDGFELMIAGPAGGRHRCRPR